LAGPAGALAIETGTGGNWALAGLGEETGWIASTWGGPEGLAASGTGWGAFDGRLLVADVPVPKPAEPPPQPWGRSNQDW
jgi:hypothetical protein